MAQILYFILRFNFNAVYLLCEDKFTTMRLTNAVFRILWMEQENVAFRPALLIGANHESIISM